MLSCRDSKFENTAEKPARVKGKMLPENSQKAFTSSVASAEIGASFQLLNVQNRRKLNSPWLR